MKLRDSAPISDMSLLSQVKVSANTTCQILGDLKLATVLLPVVEVISSGKVEKGQLWTFYFFTWVLQPFKIISLILSQADQVDGLPRRVYMKTCLRIITLYSVSSL